MEKRTRRKFSADFKAKVVIEALKERSTIEEIARKHELHPNQISQWKKEFLEKAAAVFESEESVNDEKQQREQESEKLYARIGQLEMQNNWLKKKLDL
jgi:transposase-like protein